MYRVPKNISTFELEVINLDLCQSWSSLSVTQGSVPRTEKEPRYCSRLTLGKVLKSGRRTRVTRTTFHKVFEQSS